MAKTSTAGDTGSVQRIYRRRQLRDVTGYSVPHIYAMIDGGTFPPPVRLGPRSVGWLESDIAKWQQGRIAAGWSGATVPSRKRTSEVA